MKDAIIRPTDNNVINKWSFYKDKFGAYAFIGQVDDQGIPNGIVRMIHETGMVFEGYFTSKMQNGFGRMIVMDGKSCIGMF